MGISSTAAVTGVWPPPLSPHGAPCSIQSLIAVICSSVSLVPSIGMPGFSLPAMSRNSRLSAALPGTRAGPRSPPFSALSRVRRSRRESCITAPWHFQQLVSKTGRICCGNETGSAARNSPEPANSSRLPVHIQAGNRTATRLPIIEQAVSGDAGRGEASELGREGGSLQPEHPGGLRFVSAGFAQGLFENGAFHIRDDLRQIEPFVG